MAIRKTTTTAAASTEIHLLKQCRVYVDLLGTTGMYQHAMAAKAQRTLLLGGSRKTAAEKKHLKHDPPLEFRSGIYTVPGPETLLGFPAAGIKAAMAVAALETEGVKKTSVERLIFLPQERVPVWGIPKLRCDVVRSADMARTPDIRTRAFLPEWAARVEIRFVDSLSEHDIFTLLANAGMVVGIGDFRQGKGKGSYGTFMPVLNDEMRAEFDRIVATQGREVQEKAMEAAEPYDADTEELLEVFYSEFNRRRASAA